MTGIEHFTFHLGGPTELMMAGSRFQQKGYQTFWGPGASSAGIELVLVLQQPARVSYRI
ncbi:hypothetical protein LNO18_20250 [Klebsiella variicola subsp. variicola]|nr:hypothetical protein [Klebsiella variicola subsp. variicola]